MVASLKDNSLDVAVVLTEGIVKGLFGIEVYAISDLICGTEIVIGDSSFKPRLVATYVNSPLTWYVVNKI